MKTLTWWATTCSGGLCDRFLGIITTLAIAKELGREFFIRWENIDISDIMRISEKYDYFSHNFPLEFVPLNNYEAKEFFEDEKKVKTLEEKQHILIWSNQNLFWHLCQNKAYQNINYEEKLKEAIQEFKNIFTFPNLPFIVNLENYTGIHIRTIDKAIDTEEKKESQIPVITGIFEKIKNERGDIPVFIASDCDLAYDIAKKFFKDVVFNDGAIIHTAYTNHKEGWNKVLLDLFSLERCKELYIGWNSNFSRIGALLNWNRNFFCYDPPSGDPCGPRVLSGRGRQQEDAIKVKLDFVKLSSYFSDSSWRMHA